MNQRSLKLTDEVVYFGVGCALTGASVVMLGVVANVHPEGGLACLGVTSFVMLLALYHLWRIRKVIRLFEVDEEWRTEQATALRVRSDAALQELQETRRTILKSYEEFMDSERSTRQTLPDLDDLAEQMLRRRPPTRPQGTDPL